jgi:hypothetical protein
VGAAKEHAFVATDGRFEVLETRTGAVYAVDGAPRGKVSEWKGVKVVRTDPVLGTRVARDLHVTRRGG